MSGNRYRFILLIGWMTGWAVPGCDIASRPASGPDAVVARVNNEKLTVGDLTADMQTALLPVATSEMKQDWVQKWIQSELLYQEALRRNLNQDRRIARELKKIERDYLANILLERLLENDRPRVAEEEITRYYETHKKEFVRQEQELRLGVIVLQNEGEAREVWRNLVWRNADFGETARTRSIDAASAQSNGDLGFLKRTDITDPAFRDLVFGMKVGELSKPVRTPSGYCIVKAMEAHDVGSTRALDDVRGDIINRVLEERRRNKTKQLLDRLRQKADVEVNRIHLISPPEKGGAGEQLQSDLPR